MPPSDVIVQQLSDLMLDNWRHILNISTLSERKILKQWCLLSVPARWIILNLHNRIYQWYRLSELDYWSRTTAPLKDESEQIQILEELCKSSFLSNCSDKIRRSVVLERFTILELKELCKVNKLKVSGKKSTLIQRLCSNLIEPIQLEPCYILRHTQLFRRIWTQVLLEHSGSTQSYMLQFYDSIPWQRLPICKTPSLALHHTRREYREYRYWKESQSIDWNKSIPSYQPSNSNKYRFSGYRFWKYALRHQPNWNDPSYRHHCEHHLQHPNPNPLIRQQIALNILREGDARSALDIMIQGLNDTMPLSAQIQFTTSLQHIARRAKRGSPPPPALHSTRERRLMFDTSNFIGTRKSFNGQVLEIGVVEFLKNNGIMAYRTENTPWNALFILFFLKAILLTVPHTMPSPVQNLPVDFGTPYFYTRRKQICDQILMQLQNGSALPLFDDSLQLLEYPVEQYHIRGFNIVEGQLPDLRLFASIVPSKVLYSIMRWKLLSPIDTSRGFPDLCVHIQEPTRVPALFPSKIPAGFHFVELKSKSDTLSPYQKAWIHRFISDTCSIEVWNVF